MAVKVRELVRILLCISKHEAIQGDRVIGQLINHDFNFPLTNSLAARTYGVELVIVIICSYIGKSYRTVSEPFHPCHL